MKRKLLTILSTLTHVVLLIGGLIAGAVGGLALVLYLFPNPQDRDGIAVAALLSCAVIGLFTGDGIHTLMCKAATTVKGSFK